MSIDNPLPRTKKVLSHAGVTGAILTTKLIHSMRRDGLNYKAAQFEDAFARFLPPRAEHPNTQAWGGEKE